MSSLRKFKVWIVVFSIFMSCGGIIVHQSEADSKTEDMISLIIQLEGQPIMPYKDHLGGVKPFEDALSSHISILKSQHEKTKSALKSTIPNLVIKRDYLTLFNGMAIEVPEKYIQKLVGIPNLLNVYPDGEVHPDISETVPMINADDVWYQTNATGSLITGKDVLVSVIDSGIDYTHTALGGGFGFGYRVVGGYDYINDDTDPIDDWWHGTHVAGIIGANGTKKGIAPDVKFLAYKVFDARGGGGTWSNVIAAMEASADPDGDPGTDDGADIISMSLGGGGDPDSPVSHAVDNAFDSGIIVITSTGNGGPGNRTVEAPANARKAIAVGSVTKSDSLVTSSSRGPSSILGIKPNVLAPGSDIESTMPGGGYAYRSGTSMAAPHVSGTAALVIQAHPDWDQNMTRAAIINTAINLDCYVNWQGTGRIDAYQAVNAEAVIIPDSVSMGIVDVKNVTWNMNKTLKIVNTLNSVEGYDLSISMASHPGVTVTLNTTHINLFPYQTAFFKLNVTLDNIQALEHWYEGIIIANSTTENLSVPFFFIKENLTVLATPNPSNGKTKIKVFSPVDLEFTSIKVEIELPDKSIQNIPMAGGGREWTGTFTVTQDGVHIINASSTDKNGNNNTGGAILIGDLIPPDFSVTANPNPADYYTYINVTSNENISGVWFPDERITSNDGLESMYPELAIDSKDNLHMVWPDDGGDGKNSIYYMRYDKESWKNAQIISDPADGGKAANDAKLAVDSNDFVHVIFHESIGNWYGRMYYCKINGSNGTVVLPYFNITDATNFIQNTQTVSDMAVDSSNRIHAVGKFYMKGEYATYIVLDDNGTVLDYDINVKASNIAIDSFDNIHMVYVEDEEIYYYTYDNGSMEGFKKVTDGLGNNQDPDLVTDTHGNVHLIYLKFNTGIYYRKFYISNFTWGISTKLTGHNFNPVIGVEDAGNLHLVYRASVGGIFYKKFDAISSTWSGALQLSLVDRLTMAPAMAIDTNYNIYVVWHDYRDDNNEELYWARYRSSPYFTVRQPDGTSITMSMSKRDTDGQNFSNIFYPTQDGTHYVNATGIDLAGNIKFNTTSFEALVPPFISDPMPKNDAHTTNTKPPISATLWDYSGVDVGTVIIIVNGTNVTSDAIITTISITYTPSQELWVGQINVSIICSDINGNKMKEPYNWTFFIDKEPPSPIGLTADLSGDDIVLTWNAPNSPDNNHYLIYKSLSPGNFNFSLPYHNTSGDPNPLSTTWVDVDAASNWTVRYYVVRVVDNYGKNDSNKNIASNGDWVVIGTQNHTNISVIINGNLFVRDNGILILDNFNLNMNSTDENDYTIEIKGLFNLTNSSKITSISSYNYNITVENFGYFKINNSTLQNCYRFFYDQYCGGEVTDNTIMDLFSIMIMSNVDIERNLLKNMSSIEIRKTLRFTHNTIFNCNSFSTMGGSLVTPYVAHNNFTNCGSIALLYGSDPYVYNNTITSATSFGIYVLQSNPIIESNILLNNPTAFYIRDGSNPTIKNSTVIGGDKHFRLRDDVHPVAINTTFNRSKVSFEDAISSLTIKWYMNVFVKDIIGEPVVGAVVNVKNASGGELQTGITGFDGYVKWLPCTNSTIYPTITIFNDPHNVTVTKDGLTGYAVPQPIMNASKQVNVTLETDFPPWPPVSLTVEINGNDLTLKWDASLSSDLAHYLIFRANSADNFDFSIPWRDTSIDSDNGIVPQRTSWNVTGAAVDSNNYFYVVRAVDNSGQNDSNTYTVGKFIKHLTMGWNMFSVPLVQKDTAISSVLATIAGKYDVVEFFDAFDNKWHTSNTDLTDVNHTMAIWIHMQISADLILIGTVPETTTIYLSATGNGWNLVGYPCFSNKYVNDSLSSIDGLYDAVQAYESQDSNDPWKHYKIGKPSNMNDLEYMNPGYGYLVHVTVDCVLTLID
ncbi:MAG: hypothetical protein A7315_02645 [Candidatus Altiarchaeales archaeon WOR_SM1_79]|nr:MAG: hypothetical protein A7315_02645 [Candidatus Altiarchaeales archaeon WOR_SM1_79]